MDEVVKQTVDLFNTYFEYDNKTAYIFTGDHGMTDAGVAFKNITNPPASHPGGSQPFCRSVTICPDHLRENSGMVLLTLRFSLR